VAQDLRDARWGQLARSPRTRRVIHQSFLAAKEKHGALSRKSPRAPARGLGCPRVERHLGEELLLHASADRFHYLLFVRELPGLEFRVHQVPVHGQLKATSAGGDQLEVLDLLFVPSQQFGRQTDGLRLVVSHRAILQLQIHASRSFQFVLGGFVYKILRVAFPGFKARDMPNDAPIVTNPPTVVVRHPRENVRKCSIWPLRDRADFVFLTHPVKELPPLDGYIRLAAEGPELSRADAKHGLLLLDSSWRWLGPMSRPFLDVPPRSLRVYQTAFPRRSKLHDDPDNGLATVEALFLAHHILGRPTEGLLDHYRWAEEFLRINRLME
jgi:pre-rRNA-processing protein TSR3